MVMVVKREPFQLPEGVPAELTVSELEEMACRQQQQIESQRQLLAAKEQRLRFLKQHEAKHQLVATEHERLRRLRDKVETQEQKLRKLRALRGQVDQTKLNNVSLTSDLESIRALFNEKEKELSIAVAKVEELTRQLEELRGRDSNSNQVAPSVAAVELEKLRSELLYRNKLNEQHSARLSHQRELLAQRQEEMAAIDRRIGELQERLHRKRMLNQQIVHHGNNKQPNQDNNQKFSPQQTYPQSLNQNQSLQKSIQFHQQQQQLQQKQHQQKLHQMQQIQMQKQQLQQQQMQMQMQTSPSGFNNLSAISKTVQLKASNNTNATSQGMGPMTKNLPKTSTGTNIAAVEPYHHVPSVKSSHQSPVGGVTSALDNKRNFRKSDQLDATPPSNQRIVYPSHPLASQKELKPQPVIEDRLTSTYPSPAGPSLNSSTSNSVDDDRKSKSEESPGNDSSSTNRVGEFWPNKFDSKYQTLPTGGIARYNLTRYDYRRPAEGIESSLTTNVAESNQKFNSNDKRLSNDGYSNVNNGNNNHNNHIQSSNSVKESAEMNEASQHNNSSNCGADISAKNSTNVSTANTSQQQPSHMQPMNIVRSMPIQATTNKGLATPLSNTNYVPRCTATNINNFSRSYETPAYSGYNHSSENHSAAPVITCSSTVVTYTSTYQKPVSSVSPIYQTSSTRIQPVQPQIIGSFSAAYNQQSQETRKSYQQNDATSNNYPKPALPPKPAAPVKATPPPPPRQSAFHSQFVSQMEGKSVDQQSFVDPSRTDVDTNGNAELESRLAGLDVKEKPDTKKYYSRDTVDVSTELDSNSNTVRGLININARNGITFHKEISLKKSDSPPPLPNVEPPTDDDLDKSMKLKTIYVQNVNDKNNNGGGGSDKESSRIHQISDRLMSDLSQDSSSSDTSSAENNYFVSSNRRIELPPAYLFPESGTPPRDLVASNAEKDVDIILNLKSADQLNVDASENDKTSPSSLSPDSEGSADKINAFNETKQCSDDIKKIKKGNLKNTNSANNKRRVSFDPLALLLDASLEGELELVVRTAGQVKNPSAANDEGITALHNAICAGHFEIVKFLVQFGCDVNAQDSDGWTPLHCAASCNNLPMVRFLVEHGACIFATTLSDQETAAEKCEEDEEGFDGCSEFLYSVQEKLGILNNGAVYAVFDYEAHNVDELSFKEGDRLTVLRKGDEWEREWWWSRLHDKEGYIPRNLLGLYPRIHGNTNKVQD